MAHTFLLPFLFSITPLKLAYMCYNEKTPFYSNNYILANGYPSVYRFITIEQIQCLEF